MSRRKSAKWLIALLLMISVVVTTGTFAYWTSNIEGTSTTATSTLLVGSGNSVKTNVSVSPDQETPSGYLVPAAHIDNSIGLVTEKVNFLYQINWQEQQSVTQVSGDKIYGNINANITYEIIADGDTNPLDIKEYSEIYSLIHIKEYDNNPSKLLLNDTTLQGFGSVHRWMNQKTKQTMKL